MSFSRADVGRFLRSFQDEQRAQLDVDFVPGVHAVIPQRDTFKFQSKLPQLPVPPLADTIRRYLRSLRPIQTDPAAYARSEAAAQAFLESDSAATLQQALEARARKCVHEKRGFPHTHWLEEWWEHLAYLSGRDPLALNLNCFGTLFRGVSLDFGPRTDTNLLALTRAAAVVYGTMQFRHSLRAGQLGPEALDRRGTMPLCMAQFNRVFSSVREPGAAMDKITQHDVDSDPAVPPHAAVWCEGRWYRMPLVRGDQRAAVGAASSSASSSLAVFTAYLQSLLALQRDAQQRRKAEGEELPLAVLTSAERTFWSGARDELRGSSAEAEAALRTVESAVFHVVLSPERPATDQERMNLCCHGGRGGVDLWMDKSLTYLVFANGEVGFNMEHTHADAPVHARIVEHMRVAIVQDLASSAPAATNSQLWAAAAHAADALALPPASAVDWGLGPASPARPRVAALVAEAAAVAAANIAKHRLDLVTAPQVSSGRLKAARMSPDSFVQVALQVAFHRDQGGRSCSTYETGTTRAFLHGRTATIRSCTAESRAFAQALAAGAPAAELVKLMQAALAAHGGVLRESVQAKGVDRHLLGLRLLAMGMMQQAGAPDAAAGTKTTTTAALAPALAFFEDEGFKNSSTWELSTSNMTWSRTYDYPGFGAPTKPGYGVCYNITDSCVLMTVTSNAASDATKSPTRFAAHITRAMDDMLRLAEAAQEHAAQQKKNKAQAPGAGRLPAAKL